VSDVTSLRFDVYHFNTKLHEITRSHIQQFLAVRKLLCVVTELFSDNDR
jgi:hypothetical protein